MLFPINHILFPTDFSKNAQRALPFAAEIAHKTEAQLTLFHGSQNIMDLAPNFENATEKTINAANVHFDKLLADLRKNTSYKLLTISTILQSGEPVTSFLNQIKKDKPDLIVLGTQGATSDRNALFGSFTTSVIKKSRVPVLAVPNGSKFDKFRNIVFATDYQEGDLAALLQTIALAKLFNSTIDVVHVSDQKGMETEIKFRGFRELITNCTDYKKISFHLKYEYDFFPGMADYFIDKPTSLLVMVRYQRTLWEKLTERNHSKEMAFYSDVPLLMLLGDEMPEQSLMAE